MQGTRLSKLVVQLVLKYNVDLFSRKGIFWDTLYFTKPKCEAKTTGGVGKCLQRQRLPRLWLSRQVESYYYKIETFTFFSSSESLMAGIEEPTTG